MSDARLNEFVLIGVIRMWMQRCGVLAGIALLSCEVALGRVSDAIPVDSA